MQALTAIYVGSVVWMIRLPLKFATRLAAMQQRPCRVVAS